MKKNNQTRGWHYECRGVSAFTIRLIIMAVVTLQLSDLASSALAADRTWQGTSGTTFNNAASWTTTVVPGASDQALVNNGGVVTISSGETWNLGRHQLGPTGGTTQGYVSQTAGTFAGGQTSSQESHIGDVSGSVGIWNKTGGAFSMVNTLQVGASGNGQMNISASTATDTLGSGSSAFPTLGRQSGSWGMLDISGTANVNPGTTANALHCGEVGTGILNVRGGTFTATGTVGDTGGSIVTPNSSGGVGIINLLGGTTLVNYIGKANSSTRGGINFNGGTLKANSATTTFLSRGNALNSCNIWPGGATIDSQANAITIANGLVTPAGTTGTEIGVTAIALNGGGSGYQVPPIVKISGGTTSGGAENNATAIATISGGAVTGFTITSPGRYTAGNPPTTVTLLGGGYTSAAGNPTSITTAVNTSGGLTKLGSAALTLSGACTYTGNTTISAGTLTLGSSASINNSTQISIAAGATFNVSAIASYTLSGTTTLSASGTGTTAGSTAAVITGGTTVSLGSQPINLTFTPTSFTGDGTHPSLYISAGTLSLNGNVLTVNNASGTALGAGTYVIIQQAIGSITSSGSYSVTVSGSGVAPGNAASISVSGGNVNLIVSPAAAGVYFSQQPTDAIAGASISPVVTVIATNASGTVMSGVSVSVALTNASLGSLSGATTQTTDGSGVATFTGLNITLAGAGKVLVATSGTASNISSQFTINVGTANKLVMKTAPSSSVTAGAVFSTQPAVYIEDQYGNVRTGDNTEVVTATVQTGTGPLTGTTTATASSGVATFSGLAAPTTAQTGFKLQFTDTADGLTLLNDTTSIIVNPDVASKLVMKTASSSSVTAGAVFSTQPAVYIEDQYGNVRTGDNTEVVTATVQTGTGPLTGTTTATASSGVATFSGLAAPTTAQTGFKLQFTDTADGLTLVNDTTSITVSAGAFTALAFATQPGGAVYGSAFGTQPVIKTVDQYGNPSISGLSANLTVTISLFSGSGTLQGTTTYDIGTSAGNGVVTCTGLQIDNTADAKVLQASASSALSAASATLKNRWSFNEGSGTTFADSVGGKTATLLGTSDGSAAVSGGVSLHGTSGYIDLPSNGTSGTTHLLSGFSHTTFTIEVWEKLNSASGLPTDAYLWSFGNSSGGEGNQGSSWTANSVAWGLGANNSGSGVPDFFATPGCGGSGSGEAKSGSTFSYDTTEHYWVFVYSATSGNIKLYHDGSSVTLQNQGSFPAISSIPDLNAWIGRSALAHASCANDNYLNVTVDEFRIWDGTLSSGEVTSHNTGGANQGATLTVNSSSFNVSGGATSVSVNSSGNPSGFSSAVSFTATLPSDATGNVVFLTNGAALCTSIVQSGVATSIPATTLPRGTNTVTAQYVGDTKYLGSTNDLSGGQVVTNHAPVAVADMLTRGNGISMKINPAALVANDTDADSDILHFDGVSAMTTNGSSLAVSNGYIYVPASSVNDSFTYVIDDGFGGTNTGTVTLNISNSSGQQTTVTTTPSNATAYFFGVPGATYVVVRATNVGFTLGVNVFDPIVAPSNGLFSVTDDFSDLDSVPSSAFYQLLAP